MKVVVNRCWGGFSLSQEACEALGLEWDGYGYSHRYNDKDRTDPKLVEVVEKLGDRANGSCAELRVIEIPNGIDWYIDDYDGMETVREKHRSW
jgi:hypothetical protein